MFCTRKVSSHDVQIMDKGKLIKHNHYMRNIHRSISIYMSTLLKG
jgi:hypothetical protein